MIKTTPDRATSLATELSRDTLRCVALCYNGVIHAYLSAGDDLAERIHALAQTLTAELHSQGGDWHSRWLPATPPSLIESAWLNTLEQAIHEA